MDIKFILGLLFPSVQILTFDRIEDFQNCFARTVFCLMHQGTLNDLNLAIIIIF